MKTTMSFRHALAPTIPVAFALALGACGGEKQLHAESAPTPPAAPVERASAPAPTPVPDTATATNISISESVLRACNIPDGDAYFAFDSSRLTAFDHTPLEKVAHCFTAGPMAGHGLELVGHADPRGATEYNVALGQSRADSVASYLSSRGLSRTKESTTSRGAMDATGHDETGWAHDRRVDVLIAN